MRCSTMAADGVGNYLLGDKTMQEVTTQPPEELTIKNVQFWCKHTKELKNSQKNKALKFVDFECIKYTGFDEEFDSRYTFLCLPLNEDEEVELKNKGEMRTYKKKPYPTDYNNSTYKIFKNNDGIFECNCQGWQTKERRGEGGKDGVSCSHVLALFYAFKMRLFGREHGGDDKHIEIDDPNKPQDPSFDFNKEMREIDELGKQIEEI